MELQRRSVTTETLSAWSRGGDRGVGSGSLSSLRRLGGGWAAKR